ncbi:HPr(Ser) kinase/phosphatase [Clostridium formicaceticum]|uniref:HPr kinase/phosphorylase n=1 Tax=Clostridium formicaceticum TaxID=1497 RepID=A0AAC9WHW7_9CLOT|nr:HPr(Ser) kinase/phosphatase [Clostridium formicaceticum]AOY74799.1 HPr kinase/phosphorylase [Clostridium formicaceticum]ARE89189.1 HPr kinase/phosphorylase [Clostridium formicaceticum]
MKYITVRKLIEDLKLEELNRLMDEDTQVISSDLNRPGIQLAGYFDYFAHERIQIIGKVEHRFLNTLDADTRKARFDKILSYDIPCLILSRDLEAPKELMEAAEKYQRKILRSSLNTTKLFSKLATYLEDNLADTITLHGVLMDIYGVGVLITGKSGIGKSETAIELIKRGHLFVADDAVEVKRIGQDYLVACAPEITRHMMEVRGIGIMDVKSLFGVGAIKIRTDINLVVSLEEWDTDKSYDRLGLDESFREILGIKVEEMVIPVKPARNIAVIIEVAARNHRLKIMGYNAAKAFSDKLLEHLTVEKQ